MKIANANGGQVVGPRAASGDIQVRFPPGDTEDKRGSDSRLSIFLILFRLSSRSTSRLARLAGSRSELPFACRKTLFLPPKTQSRAIFDPNFRTLLHYINYLVWFNHRPKECSRVALLPIRYAREAGFVHEVRCRCEDETGWHVVPVTEIGTQHIF